jgi:hypothetical protein
MLCCTVLCAKWWDIISRDSVPSNNLPMAVELFNGRRSPVALSTYPSSTIPPRARLGARRTLIQAACGLSQTAGEWTV